MLSVLRQPHGRRLFAALLQSRLGTGAAYVALLLVAYDRLHSPWAVSLVLLADFLPGIALSPLCGALADRYPRRTLAIGADLLSAGAFIALATTSSYLATITLALTAGVGTALAAPTLNAALSDMFASEQRSAASALRNTMASLGITLGPAIAAGMMVCVSPPLVLAINGATFVVSAALVSTVDLGPAAPDDTKRSSLIADAREGVRVTARTPGLAAVLAIDTAAVLAGGVINVAEPIFATATLHAGATGYSVLVSAYGAGMVGGSLWAARLGARVATLRRWWLGGLLLVAVGLTASALAPELWVALATFALTGAGNALVFVQGRIVQEITPSATLGRVFGLRDFGANVAFVAASIAAGALVASVGSRLTFAVAGAAMFVITAIARRRFARGTDGVLGPDSIGPADGDVVAVTIGV